MCSNEVRAVSRCRTMGYCPSRIRRGEYPVRPLHLRAIFPESVRFPVGLDRGGFEMQQMSTSTSPYGRFQGAAQRFFCVCFSK